MGKRFAMVIGIAAAGVMALGAQPAAAVVKHDTKVGFTWDKPIKGTAFFHSGLKGVQSARKCEVQRHVVFFKQRRGKDRKFADALSEYRPGWENGAFGVIPPEHTLNRGVHIYVKVMRRVLDDGDVCLPDRSVTKTYPNQPD